MDIFAGVQMDCLELPLKDRLVGWFCSQWRIQITSDPSSQSYPGVTSLYGTYRTSYQEVKGMKLNPHRQAKILGIDLFPIKNLW